MKYSGVISMMDGTGRSFDSDDRLTALRSFVYGEGVRHADLYSEGLLIATWCSSPPFLMLPMPVFGGPHDGEWHSVTADPYGRWRDCQVIVAVEMPTAQPKLTDGEKVWFLLHDSRRDDITFNEVATKYGFGA